MHVSAGTVFITFYTKGTLDLNNQKNGAKTAPSYGDNLEELSKQHHKKSTKNNHLIHCPICIFLVQIRCK